MRYKHCVNVLSLMEAPALEGLVVKEGEGVSYWVPHGCVASAGKNWAENSLGETQELWTLL